MADYTQNPQRGFAPNGYPAYVVAPQGSVSRITSFAGAAVSLALVVGIGVWGYKLIMRDVTGIPVVRAVAGEMRIRPAEAGGDFAEHQGLSVNRVAAVGTAEERAEQVRLAPQPVDLVEEDQPMPEMEFITQQSAQTAAAPAAEQIAAALESGSVDSLVAQLTDGVAPMEALPEAVAEAEGEAVEPLTAPDAGEDVTQQITAAPDNVVQGAGMRVSLRPALRPARSTNPDAVVPVSAPVSSSGTAEVAADSLPPGSRLVQLGAFDTPDIARAQWSQLNSRFAPFMEGKQRVVMQAQSGGRVFYRLRAAGFADIGDARRFCSALVAESVDCIPVVTR